MHSDEWFTELNAHQSFPLCGILPLQAARVTHACDMLKDTGPEIRARPMQYRETSQLDLDSLVTFISSLDLRVMISCRV